MPNEVDEKRRSYMEVGLLMGPDQIMCEGPRRAGIPATITNLTTINSPNFGNTMRGYLYGPPIEVVAPNLPALDYRTGRPGYIPTGHEARHASVYQKTVTGISIYEETILASRDYELYFYFNLQDPAYQAFTPPYFYGESSKILSYIPDNEDDTWGQIWNQATNQGAFYNERYNTGSYHGDTKALCLTLPSTSSVSVGSGVRMKIDASLEFSDPIEVTPVYGEGNTDISYIAPWWTCPVLDFSSSYSAIRETINPEVGAVQVVTTASIKNIYHDITTGRGMWGGYGTDPYDPIASYVVDKVSAATGSSKGIYISVKNIFVGTQAQQVSAVDLQVAPVGSTPQQDGFYSSHKVESWASTISSSLAQKLGFKIDKYPIGEIASNKKVTEAIVVIPYLNDRIHLIRKKTGDTGDTTDFVDGQNIKDIIQGDSSESGVLKGQLGFPGGELYSTREIIPGKHFLPIHRGLFNNILSLLLTKKYIPAVKRGASPTSGQADKENYNIIGAESADKFETNINNVLKTDVGKMIQNIIGDLTPYKNVTEQPDLNYTHNLGLQLPPEFDFVHNGLVNPFQMLVIPFEHLFSKQDLIDMYQGIMPQISRRLEKVMRGVTVNPMAGTLREPPTRSIPAWIPHMPMEDDAQRPLADLGLENFLCPPLKAPGALNQSVPFTAYCDPNSIIPSWLNSSKDFYENLRFMVFKVKQRAAKNYKKYRSRQIQHVLKKQNAKVKGEKILENITLGEIYGANWPYDYFSLLETIKIDVEFEVPE